MSEIVGGFYLALGHPEPCASEASSRFWSDLLNRLKALNPTTLLLMGNDITPVPGDVRPYGIGCEACWALPCGTPGPDLELTGNPALAGHIALHGFDHGLDWHFESRPCFQAPLQQLMSQVLQPLSRYLGRPLPCVPLLLHNPAGISLHLDGCETLGHAINQAVREQHCRERVVLIACHEPVVWPTPEGNRSASLQALLRRAIETVDLQALRELHQHLLDSQDSAALELLVCALKICATRHCQWLAAEDGLNGVQLWPHYLHAEKPNRFHDEYDHYLSSRLLRAPSPRRW